MSRSLLLVSTIFHNDTFSSRRVAEHSAENNMHSNNLAICFWPTLLRPEFTSFEKMTLVSKQLEEIIVCLIDEPDFYFGNQNET